MTNLTEFNGKVYFGGASGQYASSNRQLFSYDAVNGLPRIGSWTDFRRTDMIAFGDRIYFLGYDKGVTKRTWFHDGDPTHTVSKFFDDPVDLYHLGERLLLVSTVGNEFWSFDGESITKLWEDGRISGETVLGGKLYFSASGFLEDGSNVGNERWVTDGITAPRLVADINSGPESSAIQMGFDNPFASGGDGLRLSGDQSDDVLVSSPGDDTMTGKGGADRFVFGVSWGMDQITDYEDGVDVIDLSSSGLVYGDLSITQLGSDTLIDGGEGNTITLRGVTASAISEADFEP